MQQITGRHVSQDPNYQSLQWQRQVYYNITAVLFN